MASAERESSQASDERPLPLILARNLITNVALPGFLTDADGALLFFNEAAAEVLGRRFEEVGRLSRNEWAREFGPFDEEGAPVAANSLPLGRALREGRPAQGAFRVRVQPGQLVEVEATALPLLEPERFEGAMIFFWPVEQGIDEHR